MKVSFPTAIAAFGVCAALPAAAETSALTPGGAVGGLLLLAGIVGFYFLPTIIAKSRAHTSAMGIFVLNLLLGWTILGWIVALVWAFSGKDNSGEASRQRYEKMMAARSAGAAEAVKTCPFCAESVNAKAIKCKHCGSDLRAAPPTLTTRA
jgi:nitrate reductase gamma subunit